MLILIGYKLHHIQQVLRGVKGDTRFSLVFTNYHFSKHKSVLYRFMHWNLELLIFKFIFKGMSNTYSEYQNEENVKGSHQTRALNATWPSTARSTRISLGVTLVVIPSVPREFVSKLGFYDVLTISKNDGFFTHIYALFNIKNCGFLGVRFWPKSKFSDTITQ